MTASQLHPPVSVEESPIIRCLGLNYRDHAREAKMPIPSHPVLFIKPRAALCCGPYPQEKNPCAEKCARVERSDYEAELTVVIGGEDGERHSEGDGAGLCAVAIRAVMMVSARTEQFRNSQWSFLEKGKARENPPSSHIHTSMQGIGQQTDFDSSAPSLPPLRPRPRRPAAHLRPTTTSASEPSTTAATSFQDSSTKRDEFPCRGNDRFPLSPRHHSGARMSLIMTGTPPEIGAMRDPKVVLNHGDDIRVEIEGIVYVVC
ncbi:MAG: hypothetical protein ALECFALPRED_002093 [Alectoria fallacina]|uniref:Fumarylacetoacetase-like C-terminal domain-containing protein n=1 Tax=Alectoria fallacina TaxID=1903189 RepID=A0A8H3FK82_9LECA|nr:MAG: hypothetical protein ALECFALPRED_002093 [Alectoria fallacina]